MATTTIEIPFVNLTDKVFAESRGGTGTPNDAGYTPTKLGTLGNSATIEIPEALIGAFDFFQNGELLISWDLFDEAGTFYWERSVLANVTSAGLTEDQAEQLDRIEGKTGLIGTGSATVSAPVAESGVISGPIVIGDDYLAANGRSFDWTIDAVPGIAVGNAVCRFGASSNYAGRFSVVGVVSDASDDKWLLRFELPKSVTSTLTQGALDWSVEVRDGDDGEQITKVRNDDDCYRVQTVAKQTSSE
ncbi:MAG: hypothetical protein WBD31_13335 [Rubripirellula sp.]